jgi:hypothetical protein
VQDNQIATDNEMQGRVCNSNGNWIYEFPKHGALFMAKPKFGPVEVSKSLRMGY